MTAQARVIVKRTKTNGVRAALLALTSPVAARITIWNDIHPVTLMKSRFSAYAKGKAKYVVMTTHSENEIKKDGSKTKSGVKVSTLEVDVIATCEKVEFYGLKIANEKKKNETEHLVSFSYNCRVRGQKGFGRGREETQSELSTFRKEEDGKWYFLDGIQGA